MQKDVLRFEYNKNRKRKIFPVNYLVKNWLFKEEEEEEATLAQAMADVAEKNGMDANDMSHLFPFVLRMLKSKIDWSK